MTEKEKKNVIIYQAKNGAIELKGDSQRETLWATQKQIAEVFGVDRTVVTKHINTIFKDEELDKESTCANFALVQKEGGRDVKRQVAFYNLDIVLAVGYRTSSSKAIGFRKWATQTLKQHITKGYTINPTRIQKNYDEFLKTVEDVKKLAAKNSTLQTNDVLELVKTFASTWFSLDAFDRSGLPQSGTTKKQVKVTAGELEMDLKELKRALLGKKEATEIFAQERSKGGLSGIVGNVFQAFDGQDVYPTIEEKASNLLYFVIKNHPFVDGNKRSGAFAFVWFLQKVEFDFREKITPEALTAITLLIAESDPNDKERMVGLVLLLLKK